MKGFILDDDKRMKYTELELIKNNAIIYDSLNMPEKLDFIFLGINGISSNRICYNGNYTKLLDNAFFNRLNKETIIYTGKSNETLKKLQHIFHFKLVTLLEDENVVKENAKLTAEGLISEIIQKRPYPIENSQVVLIGFGHCGKEIYEKLTALNAKVKVVEPNNEQIDRAVDLVKIEEILFKTTNIIVNTVPQEVISDEMLEKLSKDVYLFDIASYPYGYHHEKVYGLHDYILPALPSSYAYKQAGIILAQKIVGDYSA